MGDCLQCGLPLKRSDAKFCPESTGRKCRATWWSNARRLGAAKVKGLLTEAVSSDSTPVPIISDHRRESKPHCGILSKSKRLQKTWAVFGEIDNPTTLQIQERTGSMKPSTDVDDLRRAGYPISYAKYIKTTDDGRRVFQYTLLKKECAA